MVRGSIIASRFAAQCLTREPHGDNDLVPLLWAAHEYDVLLGSAVHAILPQFDVLETEQSIDSQAEGVLMQGIESISSTSLQCGFLNSI
jgi:hypothetical protein